MCLWSGERKTFPLNCVADLWGRINSYRSIFGHSNRLICVVLFSLVMKLLNFFSSKENRLQHFPTAEGSLVNHIEESHWSCTNNHKLSTHTLLGVRSHKWSWPLRSRSHGGKHTPFLALDLQHGGWLRPLERRGQEIQRVDLLLWIPCNLTYRESKCCLKSSRHIYRC